MRCCDGEHLVWLLVILCVPYWALGYDCDGGNPYVMLMSGKALFHISRSVVDQSDEEVAEAFR